MNSFPFIFILGGVAFFLTYVLWSYYWDWIFAYKNGFLEISGEITFQKTTYGKQVKLFVKDMIRKYNNAHNQNFTKFTLFNLGLVTNRITNKTKATNLNEVEKNRDLHPILEADYLCYDYDSIFNYNIRISSPDAKKPFDRWIHDNMKYRKIIISFTGQIPKHKLYRYNLYKRIKLLRELGCRVVIKEIPFSERNTI